MLTMAEAVVRIRGDNSQAVKSIKDTETQLKKAGPAGAAAGVAMGSGFGKGAETEMKGARRKFGAATAGMGADVEKAGGRVSKASGGMASSLKMVGVAAAGMGLASVLGDSVAEAEDAAASQAKLGQVMQSMGYPQHTAQVQDYANSLGEKIAIDNDDIAKTQAKIATFESLGKTAGETEGYFNRVTQASYNMSALGFGSAEDAAVMLSKAMNSPEQAAALSRTGALTKAEALHASELAKSGKAEEARAYIMAAVEKQVSGAAEKNVTGTQKMAVASAALKEQLGTALLPVIDKVGAAFGVVAKWMADNEGVVKILIPVVLGLAAVLAVAAAAIWVVNLALWANPITWVIVAIVALIAAVVLMYQKFEWFKTIIDVIWDVFQNVFNGIVTVVKWVFTTILIPYFKAWWTVVSTVFKAVWAVAKMVWERIAYAFTTAWAVIKRGVEWLKNTWNGLKSLLIEPIQKLWEHIKTLPGKIGNAFKGLVNILTFPFRTAFNLIAKLWNSTVGNLSFTTPDWIPGIGGKGFSMPQIPELQGLATGGLVTHGGAFLVGEDGPEVVNLNPGSAVTPNGGGGTTIVVNIAGDADGPKVKAAFEQMWAAKERQARMNSLQAVGV